MITWAAVKNNRGYAGFWGGNNRKPFIIWIKVDHPNEGAGKAMGLGPVYEYCLRFAAGSQAHRQGAGNEHIPNLFVQRSQTFANRELGKIGHTMNFQLLHHLPAVGFNRLHAQMEALRDFAGAVPLGNQLKHLPFP